MTDTSTATAQRNYLPLVDTKKFRGLFLDKLGWEKPVGKPLMVEGHRLVQVAQFKGLPIWWCDELLDRPTQRAIDTTLRRRNPEHLLIFTGDDKQEWRWPRQADTTIGVNAKLLIHTHNVGQPDHHLAEQLAAIRIPLGEHPTLVDVLTRMRQAFDVESETASQEAARLMKQLYEDLAECGVGPHEATLLLARLLFLLFGDDAGMWEADMFRDWLADHTTPGTLNQDFQHLAAVLDTEEENRDLPNGDPLRQFRYVNGGLYHDSLTLPPLSGTFRYRLLEACRFDWSIISPAIFGSMFQAIESPKNRRQLGEHYTTETNILKVIEPLFLDDYRARFTKARDNKGELTKLWNDLGALRILDPACGCGNFLVVSYRELRALELEIMKRRRDLDLADGKVSDPSLVQTSIDVTDPIKVTLDHFYGIEIEEWPARIAEVAMLLMDHLANQTMAEEFGFAPDRLPIRIAPNITQGNALRTDWTAVLTPTANTIIVGNPPFNGARMMGKDQKADMKYVWGAGEGQFDYVTGWYKKAADYFQYARGGRFGFVSTNSIVQGRPVAALFRPILTGGWRIRFSHQTFPWDSEAAEIAAVHCVIIGFDKHETTSAMLYTYPNGSQIPEANTVRHINPYLLAAPDIYVEKRTMPLSSDLPLCRFGSMAADGGNLIVEVADYAQVLADPIAARYLRPFRMGRELVRGLDRWCLWMAGDIFDPGDLFRSQVLQNRVDAVRESRLRSVRPATRKSAATPHLFMMNFQPSTTYVGIPSVVSEGRRYYTVDWLAPDVIAGNQLFTAVDPDGFLFGVISSSMFITWQKAIGGRLKSDLRFSNTVVWNNLPLPEVNSTTRRAIIEAGQQVLATRALHPGWSLAEQYKPDSMDSALVDAHDALDEQVDRAFGTTGTCHTNKERQQILFQRYQELIG